MRSFSKKLAFVLAAAMVVTAFAPAAKAEAAKEMAINKQDKILYVTDGGGINDAAQVGGGKGNVQVYDFSVKNKPADWKKALKFEWSSSDEDVVTVAKGGVATAAGVGKATIYCKVTDKATNEVTTLKTKVTVKANAAGIEITNADKWDGATVETNGVVDLNRAMYDADGNKTTKRGTLVTDYTKWVAEPAAGVEIDQKTGKYTFTEAAEGGEYKLYCYSYQSSKYPKAVVTSDAIVVEYVKADKYEVDQTASNGFDLVFAKAADVKIADVTVNKIIKVGDTTGKLPMVVSGVTMSEDKKVASVSLFTNFENGVDYEISVKGYDEDVTLTAFVGKPVSMTISSKSGIQNGQYVTVNTETELTYSLFDEQGNDVTSTLANSNVLFKTANYNVNDYYVSGKTLYIYKEGVTAVVDAEFHTGDAKLTATGYFVGVNANLIVVKSATLNVQRPWGAAYPNNVVPVSDAKNAWDMSDVDVAFKVQTNHPDDTYAKDYDTTWTNSISYLGYENWIEFRSTNPDVADVVWETEYENGKPKKNKDGVELKNARIRLFKEGTTAILADIVTWNEDGSRNVNTLVSTFVTVSSARAFKNMENYNNNGHLTVGTTSGYSVEEIKFLAKDQYGDCLKLQNCTFALADGTPLNGGEVVWARYEDDWKNVFAVDGAKFAKYIPANATSKQLYINVKAQAIDSTPAGYSDVEFSFVITVRTKGSGATSLSVQAWNNYPNGNNVGRYQTPYDYNPNTECLKNTTFKVFKMNNGIKIGEVELQPMTNIVSDAGFAAAFVEANKNDEAKKNDILYFYTLERAGVNLAGKGRDADIVYTSDNKHDVILNYSQTAATGMTKYDYENGAVTAVAGKEVIYRTDDWKTVGDGTYVYTIYKVEIKNNKPVYVQAGVTSTTATLDTEKYTFVKRTSEYAEYYDAFTNSVQAFNEGLNAWDDVNKKWIPAYVHEYNQNVLRQCFEIRDTDGNPATTMFKVDAVEAPNYIFVKSITFYEEVETGVYAPYTVNIGESLVLRK